MTAETVAPGLWLIGIGPGNLEQMTILAKDVAKNCYRLYLEGYTAILPEEEEEKLKDLLGPWEKIMRDAVEMPVELLMEAKTKPIGLLVVGDPMQATTHIDLEAHCEERGINFHIVPGISATSLAVSLSGMQSYRFGRQITLPYSYRNYLPISPLETYIKNHDFGLHTLVLLDLDPTGMGIDKPTPMQPYQAVSLVEKMVDKYKEDIGEHALFEKPVILWNAILMSDLGGAAQQVCSGTLGELSAIDTGKIHTFILTAEFSGMEEEAFNRRRRLA